MDKQLSFIKETTGGWYIDLPKWTGGKGALQMVAGADTMLDMLSEGNNNVKIDVSFTPFPNATELKKLRIPTFGNGAFYKVVSCNGVKLGSTIWLCNVTEFVFGEFPKKMYINVIID